MSADLALLGETLRREDRDRYVTSMFAPPQARGALWVLYALNLELSQIRTQVREPAAGMIRLQWWREVIDGSRADEARRHPVGGPLLDLLSTRQLPLTDFHQMIDAREHDLDGIPFADRDSWRRYGQDTAGTLASLACRVLDQDCADARDLGAAWALAGLLRSVPFHVAQNWLTLPRDVLLQAGLDPEEVWSARADKARLVAVIGALAAEVRHMLEGSAKRCRGRRLAPALLPATLARVHLRRIQALGGDVFDGRSFRVQPMPLRLAWAALTGRV